MNMKIKKFKETLSEEVEDKYRVVVLTVEHGDNSITSKRIKEESKNLGFPCYIANFKGAYIEDGKIFRKDDESGFDINPSNTVFFFRGTPPQDSMLDLISEIERLGYCCVNSRESISIAADKYRSYIRLRDNGLRQPKTVLVHSEETLEQAFESLDSKFPIILKTLRGSKGVGVLFIESERALKSVVQLIYKIDKDSDILIQEYVKTDFDVRVLILDNEIIATMRRDVVEGDFRSNYSQGAKVSTYKLSEIEKKDCLRAAKAVGGLYSAVDFIASKDRPYILEVNSSPGSEGIEDANNKNIIKEVLEYFKDTKFRYTVPTQCGYYEEIIVEPFGKLIAKFDTGNSVLSVLHAENIEISGNKIKFTTMNRQHITKLVTYKTTKTGSGEEERPVVQLDMIFSNTKLTNIMFALDDRSDMGTDVLLNRYVMSRLNVMVNPQRKFMITTPDESTISKSKR